MKISLVHCGGYSRRENLLAFAFHLGGDRAFCVGFSLTPKRIDTWRESWGLVQFWTREEWI